MSTTLKAIGEKAHTKEEESQCANDEVVGHRDAAPSSDAHLFVGQPAAKRYQTAQRRAFTRESPKNSIAVLSSRFTENPDAGDASVNSPLCRHLSPNLTQRGQHEDERRQKYDCGLSVDIVGNVLQTDLAGAFQHGREKVSCRARTDTPN